MTTRGHTGGDVPLFAYGPGRPVGLIDGPRIGTLTAEALGLDLPKRNQRLFVDARQAYSGAQIIVSETSPENSVVTVVAGDCHAELPANKNLLIANGRQTEREDIVICAPPTPPETKQRVYAPQQIV